MAGSKSTKIDAVELKRRLSIFRGAFSTKGAIAVLAGLDLDAKEIKSKINSLADSGELELVLEVERDKYFRFSPAANAKWNARQQDRLFSYLVTWSTWLWSDLLERDDDSYERLAELNLDNLRWALRYGFSKPSRIDSVFQILYATHNFWYFSSHAQEGIGWFQKAVDTIKEPETLWHVRILNGFGTLLGDHGELDAGFRALKQAHDACQALENAHGLLAIRGNMARILRHQGCLEEACDMFRKNAEDQERLGSYRNLAAGLSTFLGLLCEMDRLDEAEQVASRAMELKEFIEMDSLSSVFEVNFALLLQKRGRWQEAEHILCERLKAEWPHGPSHNRARNLRTIASMLLTEKSYYRAAVIFGISHHIAEMCQSSLVDQDVVATMPLTEDARESLGDEAFDEAWEYGYGLSYDDSLSFLLRVSSS